MRSPPISSAALAGGLLLALTAMPAAAQVSILDALTRAPTARFALPPSLFEISGLAWHPDGYLLTHDDEVGVVHVIDPETGRTVERASLGRPHDRGDFEGVAVLDDGSLVVVTSRGTMVRRRPGGRVSSWSAGVGDECEIEGLARLPAPVEHQAEGAGGPEAPPQVVLACKEIYRGRDRGALILLSAPAEGPGEPHLHVRIDSDELEAAGVPTPFWASGVEAVEGGYVVLSARNRLAVYVDDDGALWRVVELPAGLHEQPEGITVDPQGAIWIADEGGDGDAGRLTRYGPPPSRR